MQLFDDEIVNFGVILGIAVGVSFGFGMLVKKFTDKLDG